MADNDGKANSEEIAHAFDIVRVKERLDMLDQRLDNIDSVVTAVVERIMKQPVTLSLACPHCAKNVEIAIIGTNKPRQ
ncbi:hypothetical protein ACFLTP_08405 [Chloroflexota bacterium]